MGTESRVSNLVRHVIAARDEATDFHLHLFNLHSQFIFNSNSVRGNDFVFNQNYAHITLRMLLYSEGLK